MPNIDHTFSIVAFDPHTRALGVAVTTASLAVGNRVPFAQFGLGAIATQANTATDLGYLGLQELSKGLSAQQVKEILIRSDEQIQTRQFIIVDSLGNVAGFTGQETIGYQGHILRNNFAVAGNMLVGPQVLESMVATFETTAASLASGLIQALVAGQSAGGDKRGKRSAALRIVTTQGHPYLDLRIDKSDTPVDDLQALYSEYRQYFC